MWGGNLSCLFFLFCVVSMALVGIQKVGLNPNTLGQPMAPIRATKLEN